MDRYHAVPPAVRPTAPLLPSLYMPVAGTASRALPSCVDEMRRCRAAVRGDRRSETHNVAGLSSGSGVPQSKSEELFESESNRGTDLSAPVPRGAWSSEPAGVCLQSGREGP